MPVYRVPPEATCTMAVRRNYAYPRLRTRAPRPTQHSASGERAPMSPEGVGATCAATPLIHCPCTCTCDVMRALGPITRLRHATGGAPAGTDTVPVSLPTRPAARLTMAPCVRAQTHAAETHVIAA